MNKGPKCDDCGAMPSRVEEIKSAPGVDLGQFKDYRCQECSNEFTALQRYFYNEKGEKVREVDS